MCSDVARSRWKQCDLFGVVALHVQLPAQLVAIGTKVSALSQYRKLAITRDPTPCLALFTKPFSTSKKNDEKSPSRIITYSNRK